MIHPLIIDIIIAIILGCLTGIITGITPGVHINLVSILLVSMSPVLLLYTSPIVLAAFIIALGITHTFLDAIPSIFLGAPDPAQVMNVLPGHRLLLAGKGYEAVKLTICGSLLCLILLLALTPIMLWLTPPIYTFIEPYMAHILIFVVILMIIKERKLIGKFWALMLFLISGILGIIVLTTKGIEQPLLPMLSGMFGISTLILSLNDNDTIPKQKFKETIHVGKGNITKALFAGTFAGSLTGMFPGLSAAQASILGMELAGDIGEHAFMILVGGIGTVNFAFSIITLYTIEKARNGAIVAIIEIINKITFTDMMIMIAVSLCAAGIATWLTFYITKKFAKMITLIDYKKLAVGIIVLILGLTTYFSGIIGILILLTSTAIGLLAPLLNIKRSHAMGCLLLPVILFLVL